MVIVQTAVSSEIVNSVLCTTFDDGSQFLTADFKVSCFSHLYQAMLTYSVVMFIVFPLGVPLVFFLLTWARRHLLLRNNVGASLRKL